MMRRRRSSAFTLVELLVVIGIVALMAGVLGLAQRDGSPAAALQAGQGLGASLVEACRSEAALSGRRTTLLIDADPASDGFLRRIYLAAESTPDSGQWTLLDGGSLLPANVFVVPGESSVAGASFAASQGTWTQARRSSLEFIPGTSIQPTAANDPSSFLQFRTVFDSSTRPVVFPTGRLVFALGRRTASGVEFGNAAAVRGLVLSSYGVPIRINEGAGFDL